MQRAKPRTHWPPPWNVWAVEDAIKVLEEVEAQLANQSERAFVDPWNLIARQHLARLYRRAGRISEATVIEAELRAQLRLSEPQNIILQGLAARVPHLHNGGPPLWAMRSSSITKDSISA